MRLVKYTKCNPCLFSSKYKFTFLLEFVILIITVDSLETLGIVGNGD